MNWLSKFPSAPKERYSSVEHKEDLSSTALLGFTLEANQVREDRHGASQHTELIEVLFAWLLFLCVCAF